MPVFDYSQIPGYAEAVDKESLVRNACFLPINETITGFEVVPMTMRHYVMLRTINSPLLTGATPSKMDVIAFLWMLSPRFNANGGRQKRKMMKPFKNMGIVRFAEIVTYIRQFVSETFQDKPATGTDSNVVIKQYYADVAYLCSIFALKFGWDDELTMSKPMKRIFQYMKVLREQGGEKVVHFNPSDKIAMQYIAEMDRKAATP